MVSDEHKAGAQVEGLERVVIDLADREAERKIAIKRLLALSLFLFDAYNKYDVRSAIMKIKLNKPDCRLGGR